MLALIGIGTINQIKKTDDLIFTFNRLSIAYSDSGRLLPKGWADTQFRLKAAGVKLDRPTGQGLDDATPEDIAPTGGIDDVIIVGVGHDSGDLYYTTDALSWTKFASPGDAYEARVFEVADGVYDAWVLRGDQSTGLDLWHYADIEGDATATRCKYGGSTSTTAEFYDEANNQNLTNAGATIEDDYISFDGSAFVQDSSLTPVVDGQSFEVRFEFLYSTGGSGSQVLWSLYSTSAATRCEILLNVSNGNLTTRIGTETLPVFLTDGFADGEWYEVRFGYDGDETWTLSAYDSSGELISSDTYTGSWSPPSINPEYTLGARNDTAAAGFYGQLRNHKLYVNGTLIRDHALTLFTALEDAKMPFGDSHVARWQSHGVDYKDGTFISGIYANPTTASVDTYLYRSTNKIDHPLVLIHEVVDTGGPPNNHNHMVQFVNNVGENGVWFALFGDNPNRADYYSEDDGVTWNVLQASEENKVQIMGMWDMPDGVSVACGHDDNVACSVRNYNVMTEFGGDADLPTQRMADIGWPRLGGDSGDMRFSWINKPINGYYYASHYFTNNYDNSCISVSRDGLNFITIAHLDTDEEGVDRIWPLNGYIIGGIRDANNASINARIQLRFKEPSFEQVRVQRVSCAAENILSLADSNGLDDTHFTTYGSATETKAVVNGAVQVRADDAGSIGIDSATFSATSGDVLTATALLSGIYREFGWLDLETGSGDIDGSQCRFILMDNVLNFSTKPSATDTTGSSHNASVFHANCTGDFEKTINVHKIAVFSGLNASHPFVIGGTAQADEILSETQTRDDTQWSKRVTVYPWIDSLNVVDDVYFVSLVNGTSNAQLKFDGSKFVLESYDGGVANTDVDGSDITWFMRNSQIEISIFVDGSATAFEIKIGDLVETLAAPAIADFLDEEVTFTTGDAVGENVMPLYLQAVANTYEPIFDLYEPSNQSVSSDDLTFNQWTVIYNFDWDGDVSAVEKLFDLDRNADDDAFLHLTNNNVQFILTAGGETQVSWIETQADTFVSGANEIIIAARENDVVIAVNGEIVHADVVATMPDVTPDGFGVGQNQNGTQPLTDTMNRVRYYNKRLPNNTLGII